MVRTVPYTTVPDPYGMGRCESWWKDSVMCRGLDVFVVIIPHYLVVVVVDTESHENGILRRISDFLLFFFF
jgi:hypothetical protein